MNVMCFCGQTHPALKHRAIFVLSLRDALFPESPRGATEHSLVFQHWGFFNKQLQAFFDVLHKGTL
ncbi:MAG: hypothetical protein D3907_12175 [Candidatus Electrothrix sp. AUS3]|nr:hypothetical protein [Candidatus Electrothrix gigas]